ncbi:MAG: alanine:cation symporter family protein [Treponema socranskii subsp. buccale]
MALRYGLSRGTASNEAGMGSAPFAHASAQTDFPVRQGLWGIYDSDCHSGSIIVL